MSGGWGLLYEAAIAGFARRYSQRLVIHHHSYNYIDRRHFAMSLLVRAAGAGAVHVCIDKIMERELRRMYGCVRTTVLSNASFIESVQVGRKRPADGRLHIIFLCNLSFEKGLGEVVELARRCLVEGLPVEVRVAGPFENRDAEGFLHEAVTTIPLLKYIGPVYGEAKELFFKDADVFVFPTRYKNEAQPLVLLEAMGFGCTVIAYGRGAIPSLLAEGGGKVIDTTGNFVESAMLQLREFLRQPGSIENACASARARYDQIRREAEALRHKLICYLSGGDVPSDEFIIHSK